MLKTVKVISLVAICLMVSSCSYNTNNEIMTKMDIFAEKLGVKKKDPGVRLASIHRGVYDFYKNYELVYFYKPNDSSSNNFEKIINQYAEEAWIKVIKCSVDKKQLPYRRDDVYDSRDIRYKYFADRYERDQIKTPALFLLLEANHEIDVYPLAVQDKVPCTGCYSQSLSDCLPPVSKSGLSYEQLISRMNDIATTKWPTLQKDVTSHNN
jgi:hypothetical protein